MTVLTYRKTVDGLHWQSCCKRWNPFIPFIERRVVYLYFLFRICCITHRTLLFDLIDDFWIVRISLIDIWPIDFERLANIDIYRGLVEVLSVDWLLVLRVFCFVYVVRMLRNGQKLALFVMICCLIADWKWLIIGTFGDGAERHLVDEGLRLGVLRVSSAGGYVLLLSGGSGIVNWWFGLFWRFVCWSGTGSHFSLSFNTTQYY